MQPAVLVGLALSASAVLAASGQEFQSISNGVLTQAAVQPEYPLIFAFPGIDVPLSIVGDAEIRGGALYLTRALRSQAGAAWFRERQPVSQGFVTTFEFLLTEQDSFRRYKGADGFALVVQNDSATAIGNRGGAAAFAGGDGVTLPRMPGISRSVAVFFDTHRNADIGDPSGNYVAVCSTVDEHSNMQWPPRRLAHTHKLKVRLKDGKCHRVRIVYRPHILFVFLDDLTTPTLNVPMDLAEVVGGKGSAFVGFTAGTGSGYQNHIVRSWSFACGPRADATSTTSVVDSSISFIRAACMPDRPLCTPDQAIIEDRGAGKYRIVLPANLEWGARIPTPPSAMTHVENAAGMVCLRSGRGDLPACNGPTGSHSVQKRNKHVLRDLLAPERRPGALIWRTGREWTYFSINGYKGAAFLHNEGYFDFEVQVADRAPD